MHQTRVSIHPAEIARYETHGVAHVNFSLNDDKGADTVVIPLECLDTRTVAFARLLKHPRGPEVLIYATNTRNQLPECKPEEGKGIKFEPGRSPSELEVRLTRDPCYYGYKAVLDARYIS